MEEFARLGGGIDVCYETFGYPDGEPLMLVMGLGGPMTWWDPELCQLFADAGYYVVRYDNRDAGRSSRLSQHRLRRSDLIRAFVGLPVTPAYTMSDLADD